MSAHSTGPMSTASASTRRRWRAATRCRSGSSNCSSSPPARTEAEMHDRPYMSIGDVLALLREEFPDITISKIRFLESQGLVDPERTPSGYRKFYDHDVDRLRWILRQQREHFLPLKVIRGRLTEQGDDDGAEEGVAEDPAATANGTAGADRHLPPAAEAAPVGARSGAGAAT